MDGLARIGQAEGEQVAGDELTGQPHLDVAQVNRSLFIGRAIVLATRVPFFARGNITGTVAACAVMCVHGGAGVGETLAVDIIMRRRLVAPTVCGGAAAVWVVVVRWPACPGVGPAPACRRVGRAAMGGGREGHAAGPRHGAGALRSAGWS
ncbi:hypothetical protein GCM10010236_08270 [Streptomyces eurythermus]|nr:hypothetical protein GCM10010236_08270 [Streptomyces eurythermus]